MVEAPLMRNVKF